MDEIKLLTSDIIHQSGEEVDRIVDKIFWRLAIIMSVFTVLLIIAVIIYKKV